LSLNKPFYHFSTSLRKARDVDMKI